MTFKVVKVETAVTELVCDVDGCTSGVPKMVGGYKCADASRRIIADGRSYPICDFLYPRRAKLPSGKHNADCNSRVLVTS